MISSLGKSALVAVVDISQVFRLLIINPADFDLLCIMFDNEYYIDKCLPMRCSISCSLFEKRSTILHKIVKEETGISTLDYYLDDFLFAGAAETNDCQLLISKFCDVASELAVPIAENKIVGPTTVLTFLGLDIDTNSMMVRIPGIKNQKLKSHLEKLISVKKIRVNVLESMLGLLAFCAKGIPSIRAFIL